MINIPLFLIQIILLVLYYGDIVHGMPWWVVLAPALLIVAIAGVWLGCIIAMFLLTILIACLTKVETRG